MISASASANVLSQLPSVNAKVNKGSSQFRKNSLRLSFRRFSHHATAGSSKSLKSETVLADLNQMDADVYPWSRCQQIIQRMACGEKIDADERCKVTISIRNLLYNSKNLVNVLLLELFGTSSVKSAFKQLALNFDNCSSLHAISAMWICFYTSILPDLHAILYPFEESWLNDIRKSSFTAFRDGVILDGQCYESLSNEQRVRSYPTIKNMLLILEQNTRDGTCDYEKLSVLCQHWIEDFWPSQFTDPDTNHTRSPTFFLGDQITHDQPPASPKFVQRFLKRNRGSFTAFAIHNELDTIESSNFLDVKHLKQSRSRSPLARVKDVFFSETNAGGMFRRHSYAPGT